MRVLYVDCFSGISGDMTVGALSDLGVEQNVLETELNKLNLNKQFDVSWTKIVKKGIHATKFDVILRQQKKKEHHHRHYKDIVEIIESSGLNENVKKNSLSIFKIIGEAEGKIHNIPLEKVHFHEVGAIDSIVDIVATAIALDQLNIDKVTSAPVPVGNGKIQIDHGVYPIPAPATLEMLKGIPIAQSSINGELTTPTGAGIIKSIVHTFAPMPSMTIEKIGYGAGTKDFENHPNVLRVVVGKVHN